MASLEINKCYHDLLKKLKKKNHNKTINLEAKFWIIKYSLIANI